MKIALVVLALWLIPLFGQDAAKPAAPETPKAAIPDASKPIKPPGADDWGSKTFDVKYADPVQIRDMFSSRSFVIDANRDLKVLTVHGPAAFLKEVEDAVKHFDVAAPPPADLQVSVYLLTSAAMAPTGVAVPADLAAIAKEITGAKLADSQMVRMREGLGGEALGTSSDSTSAHLARVRIQSVAPFPGAKGESVSLNGLQVWFDLPAAGGAPAGSGRSSLNTPADITADVDVEQNQPVVIAKAGADKPIVVVVRAVVIR